VRVISASPEKSSPFAVEKFSLNHNVLSPTAWGPFPTGRSLHTAPFASRMVQSSGVPYQTCSNGGSGGYGSGGARPGCGGTVTGQVFGPADEPGVKPGVEISPRSLAPAAQAEIIRPLTNPAMILIAIAPLWLLASSYIARRLWVPVAGEDGEDVAMPRRAAVSVVCRWATGSN
jgi:hypothetical protein